MKYDSGMTYFHKDILAALQQMCGGDTEITEKFSPDDGSPAPLRDYLKEGYGQHYRGGSFGKVRYSCTLTKGVEMGFEHILNSNGDKVLTLSWSQAAKFIRDNWDEVFNLKTKSKPKTRALEVLVKTFDETKITCPNWMPGETLTYLEKVNGVHFKCKACESDFCKLDDITKFFVSHCNRHEDCLYYKKGIAENQPSPAAEEPAETGKPTYKDVLLEHYPNFDVSRFEEFADKNCLEIFFDAGRESECLYFPNSSDEDCKKCWEQECKYKWEILENREKYIEQSLKQYLLADEEAAETVSETNQPLEITPANAEKNPAAFDYSELDNDTADKLRALSERVISIKAKYIIETAKQVKAAHDLLANHYKGLFGAWCESVGFSRHTGTNLVHVAETFPELSVVENFDNLSPSLLYEASKPSAPKELVEQVKNGDITTHAEYIKLKKELEEANRRVEESEVQSRTYRQNYLQMEKNLSAASDENINLENRIKELESRPTEVMVQQDEKAIAEKQAEITRLEDELSKTRQELLNASFGSASDTSGLASEFYETLHGSVLSAIRSCADFAKKNGSKFTDRFRSLTEVINDYINEMEEF